MNYILIALILVLIFVAVYYIYLYFTSFPYLVSSSYNLNTNNPFPSIPSKALTNITSVRYTYAVWIYVNNMNNIGANPPSDKTGSGSTKNTIFSMETGDVNSVHTIDGSEEFFSLYFQKNTPMLYLHIKGYKSTADRGSTTVLSEIIVSNNFPLQSWTHVVVSVDTFFIDIYMNGQLVKSIAINSSTNLPITPVSPTAIINFGFNQDIQISRLLRLPYQIDPGTAYNIYAQGSGQQNSSITHFNLWYSMPDSTDSSKYPQTNLIQV